MSTHPGDETCYGCGAENADGLRMTFVRTGATSVESEYRVPRHLCGSPAVVHGGVQATILDEVMGKAAHTAFEGEDRRRIVTAHFALTYRRPAPMAATLTVRGELVRVDGLNVFVSGALLGPDGTLLTTAEARWRVIEAAPDATED